MAKHRDLLTTQLTIDWRMMRATRWNHRDVAIACNVSDKQMYRMRRRMMFAVGDGTTTYGQAVVLLLIQRAGINTTNVRRRTALRTLARQLDASSDAHTYVGINVNDEGKHEAFTLHHLTHGAVSVIGHLPTLTLALCDAHAQRILTTSEQQTHQA